MQDSDSTDDVLTDEWIEHHFDVFSPVLGQNLYPTLARARSQCPVIHTDDGQWVFTRYQDVLRVAQDWEGFSSEGRIGPPRPPGEADASAIRIMPVAIDPPLQRTFKRLINAYFTPTAVALWEAPTRELVSRLIDGFIERGQCDFMEDFARLLPGLAFFEHAVHALPEDLAEVNGWATRASLPDPGDAMTNLSAWIAALVEKRRVEGPKNDVVDAIMDADIDGRPIYPGEVIGTIQLLILGGLETTAGVLGQAMLRFCDQPEILATVRARPETTPAMVEELLRLDGSFICMRRTASCHVEIDGRVVGPGDPVIIYWASANRDPAEFANPETFDFERPRNRHLAFGAGPHRCAGSNLARMNLRVALEEIARRIHDVKLQRGEIHWHSTFNRAPLSVPITFTPGPRLA